MRIKNYTPQYLFQKMSECVIGQDSYLQKIGITVWLHNKRIEASQSAFCDLNLQKHNLFCIGPTGSGKTLALSILAKLYNLDVLVADMSGYTGAGWKGKDAEDLIRNLFIQCRQDKSRTEKGIIVMDEVDKMIQQKDTKEPSFAAENALLKIIEGTTVEIDGTTIDTKNILFIAAGAFEGIEYIVKERINAGKLGFNPVHPEIITDESELLMNIERIDVLRYGMGSQFMGRFSDIAVLRKLGVPELKKILLESEASVVKSLDMTLRRTCGIRVEMDEEGAKAVAEQAIREGTGARGLAQIILPVINDVLFIIDDDETTNGILLTAKDDEPYVKLLEGERIKKHTWKPNVRFDFPAKKRKNVEHFCWNLLSVYLEEQPQTYKKMQAMHALLCSIVFFVLTSCNKRDQNLISLQKLAKEAFLEPGNDCTVYEMVLFKDEKFSDEQEYIYYYKLFRLLDPSYDSVPLLQKALDAFTENPRFQKGNLLQNQKIIKEQEENINGRKSL